MSTPKEERLIYFAILVIKDEANCRLDTTVHYSVPPINFCILTKKFLGDIHLFLLNLWEKSPQ